MHHSDPSDHARHDLALIAGHASGDLLDADRSAAQSLLTSCATCVELHADLVAIAAATRVVPAPAMRTRDFRLAPEQATRLQRGSWLRSILRPFAGTGSSVRPMAAAFSSLGVAGLLVAMILPGMLGISASAPQERDTVGAPVLTGVPANAPEPGGPGAAASPDPDQQFGAQGSAAPDDNAGEGNAQNASNPPAAVGGQPQPSAEELVIDGGDRTLAIADPSPPSLLIIASLALLAVGLGLFGLRFAARRLR
jgi:hypothetical protein